MSHISRTFFFLFPKFLVYFLQVFLFRQHGTLWERKLQHATCTSPTVCSNANREHWLWLFLRLVENHIWRNIGYHLNVKDFQILRLANAKDFQKATAWEGVPPTIIIQYQTNFIETMVISGIIGYYFSHHGQRNPDRFIWHIHQLYQSHTHRTPLLRALDPALLSGKSTSDIYTVVFQPPFPVNSQCLTYYR